MRILRLFIWFFACGIFLCGPHLLGQVSPDCQTAIPICSNTPVNGGTSGFGADDFYGASDSGCLERTLSGFIESNSAWYRFRTGAAGQLGFNIAFSPTEDWDFALYRAADCGSLGEPVRCNFFDNQEMASYMGVGEDPTGNSGSYQYEPWLDVLPGEDYYLLINNFSNTNSGFSIQFSGQIFVDHPYDALDCSIVSNLLGPPVAACQGDTVPLDAYTSGAQSYHWFLDIGSGFQPITGASTSQLDVVSEGVCRVRVTMPDGSQIISDVQVGFSPNPVTQGVSDEALCQSDGELDLQVKALEALGAQSPMEFRVSFYTNLTDAQADTNPLPSQWAVPPGVQTVYIRTTSLANPACYDTSESFQVVADAMPALDFPEEAFICSDGGLATIGLPAPEPGVSYLWDSGETTPGLQVVTSGEYTLTATSANGLCMAARTVRVQESLPPAIASVLVEDLQVSNRITLEPATAGDFQYALDGGAFQDSPVFDGVLPGQHEVRMRDALGCGEVAETITVVGFQPFFTPNGDGINDQWQVSGLEALTDPILHIFDRYGKLLKQLDPTSPGWDGTYNGHLLPAADYWFRLTYTDPRGQRVEARYLNAHFSLKR
ncbi:T9SS type B sorting domain-containing protein [Robiginitalea sediminis]|uniref:T9SS type B sorting domain-containing protein n=1 Tax=Robiginitalea sediminis TaxID=1982593 RepID=UPI000B4BF656|nr:T9SS type B sorting domain-containing protein [Robiginitalea sediminis]